MTFNDRTRAEWVEAVQEERRASVARFNARRHIEWRLALTLWGGFGLVANALRSVRLGTGGQIMASVLALAVVAMHLLWVRHFMVRAAIPNWREGRGLTRVLRESLGILEEELSAKPAPGRRPAGFPWLRVVLRWFTHAEDEDDDPRPGWGHYWQVGITLLLAMYVGLIVWR